MWKDPDLQCVRCLQEMYRRRQSSSIVLLKLDLPQLRVVRRTWNWTFPAGSGRSPNARKNYRFVKGRESRLPKQARATKPKPSRIILLPPPGTVEQ